MAERRHPLLFGFFISFLILVGLLVFFTLAVLLLIGGPSLRFGPQIGVVSIKGMILDSKSAVDQIKKFRKDEQVKILIVRVDSPGGVVGASQEIHREILRTRSKKKVIVSLGNVAASGGYYIAVAGNKIVANPGTITGSIGVILEFSNIQELLNKIGVKMDVVKSGTFKDLGSPLRRMTTEERRLIQEVIGAVHRQFVEAVAAGRNLPRDQVEKIADGRIFTGEQAKKLGLIDETGNMEDAVDLAKKEAGLTGEVGILYSEKKRFSLWELLLGRVMEEIKGTLPGQGVPLGLWFLPSASYKN